MTDVSTIVITDVVEHEDGSATYTLQISDAARDRIAREGLELVLCCAAAKMDIRDVYDWILSHAEPTPE